MEPCAAESSQYSTEMTRPYLQQNFDAVVMLTWSDWHREPRSNRYHYATRFARELPVIFVQPDRSEGGPIAEKVPGHNITILHVSSQYGAEQTRSLTKELQALGVRRPLLWIYNVYFEHFIRRTDARFRIYHGTEDYLGPNEGVMRIGPEVQEALKRVLQDVDLLVCVSEGVAESYRRYGRYAGKSITLRNGCDFNFWHATGARDYILPENGAKVAFFQGGINSRLDYDLLQYAVESLPDWEFWFCGKSEDAPAEWESLKTRSNVRDFGILSPDLIAALAQQSLVGIIPFKQDSLMRRSLPLKAYEYVACGLPVVTIPIDELASQPELFEVAETPEDFVAGIKRSADLRCAPDAVSKRLSVAELHSYDNRFDQMVESLQSAMCEKAQSGSRANILILYDDRSTHVRTIEEHLLSFQRYSRHNVFYMPATGNLPIIDDGTSRLDFSAFDAVLVHYSVRLSIEEHLSKGVIQSLSDYYGPKLLFIQDEYDNTERARRFIERLGVDAVFTNVPLASLDSVYPRNRFPGVDFIPTLTGYVPEDSSLDAFAVPFEERKVLIGYRGRKLPYQYGDLGFEKHQIGVQVKRLAEEQGLPVDIEVDDSRRIYGDDWYRFLGSCRATLGTESGSNVFDFEGTLARLASMYSHLDYADFRTRFLQEHEGRVHMNQISPKIFEAIRLRTALVLFEGEYSGVVEPDVHFIPLKKDYSNIEEVFAKLQDFEYLRELTSRAYRDVIASGRYSYKTFMASVDEYLSARLNGRTRARVMTTPMLAMLGSAGHFDVVDCQSTANFLISDGLLGRDLTRETYYQYVKDLANTRRSEELERRAREMENHACHLQNTVNALVSEREHLSVELSQVKQMQADTQQELVAASDSLTRLDRSYTSLKEELARVDATYIPPSFRNIAILIARRLWWILPSKVRAGVLGRMAGRVTKSVSGRP